MLRDPNQEQQILYDIHVYFYLIKYITNKLYTQGVYSLENIKRFKTKSI